MAQVGQARSQTQVIPFNENIAASTVDVKPEINEVKVQPRQRGRATIRVTQEVANAREKLNQIYSSTGWVVSPHSTLLQVWDIMIVMLTVVLAFWMPFQVAFRSQVVVQLAPEFIINRIVDIVLLVDMQLGFHVSYIDPKTGDTVRNSRLIILHHFRTHFILDLIAALCGLIDFLSVLVQEDEYYNHHYLASLQSVKMLRLLKFVKVYSGKGLKQALIFLQHRINYNKLSLMKFVIGIVTLAHWLACAWRLVCNFEFEDENNWIVRENYSDFEAWDLYVVSLYWATTTITTIGYGDTANPKTSAERSLATFCMMAGALLWAYIIGGVCSIVQSFNQQEIIFKETMDRLSHFMSEKHLPEELCQRLREYFIHRQVMLKDIEHAELLSGMSATLRGEVALNVNRTWLSHVPWLLDGAPGFIASIALGMEPELFAPKEAIVGSHLRVLTRGVAVKDSCIYTRGCVWGTDVILESSRLRRQGAARALTYAHVYALRQTKLKQILEHYPQERVRLRASAIWMALRRGFLSYARDIKVAGRQISKMAQRARDSGVDIKALFIRNDTDGSGDLNREEFVMVLNDLGVHLEESLLEIVLGRFDEDGTGSVDYVEFLTFFCPEVLENKDQAGLTQLRMQVVRTAGDRMSFGLVNAFASSAPVDSVVTARHERTFTNSNALDEVLDRKLNVIKEETVKLVKDMMGEFVECLGFEVPEHSQLHRDSKRKKLDRRPTMQSHRSDSFKSVTHYG